MLPHLSGGHIACSGAKVPSSKLVAQFSSTQRRQMAKSVISLYIISISICTNRVNYDHFEIAKSCFLPFDKEPSSKENIIFDSLL